MIERLFERRVEWLVASLMAVSFILILLDVSFGGMLVSFDGVVHNWSLAWHTPLIDRMLFLVTTLGNLSAMLVYSLILLFFLYLKKEWKGIRFYLIGILGSSILFSGIKVSVCRLRPSSFIGDFHQHGYSFPSGHGTMSMTLALLLFFLLYPRFSGRARRVLVAFTLLFPLVVGFSRIYLGVHYLSDVLAGFTLGIFWVMLLAWRFDWESEVLPVLDTNTRTP